MHPFDNFKHSMKFKPMRWGVAALIIAWLAVLAALYALSSSPPACFVIDRLPYVIQQPGCFEVHRDLHFQESSGAAIEIKHHNVRVDLGGHEISGPGKPGSSAVGIAAEGIQDVLIKNGKISDFQYGIRVKNEDVNGNSTSRITLRKISLFNNHNRGVAIIGKNTLLEDVTAQHLHQKDLISSDPSIDVELGGGKCRVRKNQILETYGDVTYREVGVSRLSNVKGCSVQDDVAPSALPINESAPLGLLVRKNLQRPQKNTACYRVTRVPFYIDIPGCYELRGDLHVKDIGGTGILIRSSDVRLDLGGYHLSGPAHKRGAGTGIAAEGVRNVSIENGTVSGFLYGLRVGRSVDGNLTRNFTVRKMSLLNNGFRGAAIDGADTIVEDVRILDTGGSHFFPDAFAIGLELSGNDCRIRRNTVQGIHPVGKGEGMAISLLDDTQGCVIEKNELANTANVTDAKTFGIWKKNPNDPLQIIENKINGFSTTVNFPTPKINPAAGT